MRRGELWTAAGGSDYLTKPRPVVILQVAGSPVEHSVTLCPLSASSKSDVLHRAQVEPDDNNGLTATSSAMADMITTVREARLGRRIGSIDPRDMARINRAIVDFLELGDQT